MRLFLLSGGRHPYHESTPVLADLLSSAGHDVTLTEEAGLITSPGLADYDVVIFNTRRADDLTLTREEQHRLTLFVGKGGGLVVLHIAGTRPEEWPQWHDLTGGGWVPGQSHHPPYGQFTVNVSNPAHPCAAGVSGFLTNDELYMDLVQKPDIHVFLTAEYDGKTYPLGWTRDYCDGRVVHIALGHDGLSFRTPEFQRLILNGVEWSAAEHEKFHDPTVSLPPEER